MSPETLELELACLHAAAFGWAIACCAGDRAAEALYVAQLRNRYPDSAEAKAVSTGLCE